MMRSYNYRRHISVYINSNMVELEKNIEENWLNVRTKMH